jgi:hypothetical protein
MARKNKRYDNHQSLGDVVVISRWGHTHDPIPTRWGYVCLGCGRAVNERGEER